MALNPVLLNATMNVGNSTTNPVMNTGINTGTIVVLAFLAATMVITFILMFHKDIVIKYKSLICKGRQPDAQPDAHNAQHQSCVA